VLGEAGESCASCEARGHGLKLHGCLDVARQVRGSDGEIA
jgi:hypothetical protein